jgi:hypothetical protein
MTQFYLDQSNRFIINGYAAMRPFSSFLPGIAGLFGIPMWAFYVNRGQAIASFGIESKDSPIMEFQPANKAYQDTPYLGFRTFLKIKTGKKRVFYEPFAPWNGVDAKDGAMKIGLNDLELQETDPTKNLRTQIRYFILPNEPYSGLVRKLSITNLGKSVISMELLDGLPRVIPYGVNNTLLKEMGRTVEAWMEVFKIGNIVPFYRLRASVIDRPEVETFQAGHYAVAFVNDGQVLQSIVDPTLVFEQDTPLYQPSGFIRQPLEKLLKIPQVTCGRTPCGFFAHQVKLLPDESLDLYAIFGHINRASLLEGNLSRVIQSTYVDQKRNEAVTLVDDLTQVVDTHTSSPIFDAYCRQNFLDNVLRGGWPIKLGGHVYPVYSRKHGDLERDYNAFYLTAEPYSQGEGSYRDINQNRRSNVIFSKDIGDFDIRTFLSLIQTDGYNPRAIMGITFTLLPEAQKIILGNIPPSEKLKDVLANPFTPGKLMRVISENNIKLPCPPEEYLILVLTKASPQIQADFHEGYWIDHWEYILDLIESYLTVYPDRRDDLLFSDVGLPFFDSLMIVQPRSKKYVLANGVPRQHNSLMEDIEKRELVKTRTYQPQWSRKKDGQIYRTTIFSKLMLIALLKFATLDPWGMGIEMEAGRPGWDDALNGLPGLFGSGMAETYELSRWLVFLREVLQTAQTRGIQFPQEAADLLKEVMACLDAYSISADNERKFIYWDSVSSAREKYRQNTRFGFEGIEQYLSSEYLDRVLVVFKEKVDSGIKLAWELNNGLPPTYVIYDVDDYDISPECDPYNRPYIIPKHFTPRLLPLFLEGPTRVYKTLADVDSAAQLYQRVKESNLFDQKLKMYKINASLDDQPQDIGRARAFPPGWLENESIWLHMEYKYLLEILKAGLYDQFFSEMKNILVPFLDPNIYGRSPLENSSFLVSSAHPDKTLHGAGFVARLSGSTAEFISIWNIMMAGKQPLKMQNGKLCLALKPVLPGWLFSDEGTISFRFLGHCTITYHNKAHLNTTELEPNRIMFDAPGYGSKEQAGSTLLSPYAEMVRNGQIKALDVWF